VPLFGFHGRLISFAPKRFAASQLYFVARLLGYPRVRLYDGSLADWKARGGALEPGQQVLGAHFKTTPR